MQENMRSEIVTITPEMAQAWLEQNIKCNRRKDSKAIARYARIMKAGGWSLTHQGIAFDDAGLLIDGQHRLEAIVMAGVPVEMMVTRGVRHDEGEILNIDVGRKRTVANIMQMSGIDDPVYQSMTKVVHSYYRWKRPGSYRPEPAEIINYIDRHYEHFKALFDIIGGTTHGSGKCKQINGFVGAGMLAALYRGENEQALKKFAAVYKHNDVSDCQEYNPRHALNLRDYVRDHRESAEGYARVESAICAFSQNKKQLYVKGNHYPYDPVMDA